MKYPYAVSALFTLLHASAIGALSSSAVAQSSKPVEDPQVTRGRYLIQIAGCNDCHTPGYIQAAGKVDEKLWLTGDELGWRGPWGTTYASNLRIGINAMSEAQWLQMAKTMQPRPPMPWFNLRAMSDNDLKAIYRYVKVLGVSGKPAPAWVPPDKVPAQPFVQFP
jgi:mono/diheme cytochrome c family protein